MGYYKLKIAIMQPTFNPWLGYFDLIDSVDSFIFLDNVQLTRRSWQIRNKLKVNSQEFMFSLPIKKENNRDNEIINKVRLLEALKSKKRLYSIIRQNYKKAKFYLEVDSFIKEIIFFGTDLLSLYNMNIIKRISLKLKFDTKMISISDIEYNSDSSKGDMILDICKYFDATEYISPLGSKDYLDKEINTFNKNNIEVYYQYYNHPIYGQIGKEFIPYIGIFDLLYNEGFDRSREIILSGRKFKKAEDENRLTIYILLLR